MAQMLCWVLGPAGDGFPELARCLLPTARGRGQLATMAGTVGEDHLKHKVGAIYHMLSIVLGQRVHVYIYIYIVSNMNNRRFN